MTKAKASNRLPEDARERQQFDGEVERIHGGDPIAAVCTGLDVLAKTLPKGSLAALCAIYSNEVRRERERVERYREGLETIEDAAQILLDTPADECTDKAARNTLHGIMVEARAALENDHG